MTPSNAACRPVQRSDANFIAKSGCFSCHNNSIAALAVSHARAAGVRVDEPLAAQQVQANLAVVASLRDFLHQRLFVPVGGFFAPGVLGYLLVGLDAEHHAPDLDTDAVAMYLRMHQMADGHWAFDAADVRPPLCSVYIGQTALAMRGLQLYAPQADRPVTTRRSGARATGWRGRRPRTPTTRAGG